MRILVVVVECNHHVESFEEHHLMRVSILILWLVILEVINPLLEFSKLIFTTSDVVCNHPLESSNVHLCRCAWTFLINSFEVTIDIHIGSKRMSRMIIDHQVVFDHFQIRRAGCNKARGAKGIEDELKLVSVDAIHLDTLDKEFHLDDVE